MKLFILIALTLPSFTLAADCEVRTSYTSSHNLCWNETLDAWASRDCLSGKCEAMKIKARFPASVTIGANRTVDACTRTGAGAIVLRDKNGNEESFCEFSDGSLRSASSVESSL